ncbi:MAG: T9SS type A sorting domain-containing protein [Bacteroidota bacterium]
MKLKILFSFFFTFFFVFSFSQPNYFSKVYFAQQSLQVYEAVKCIGDNFTVVGEKDSEGFIMKIDSSGNLLWNRQLGNTYTERFTSLTQINDSTFAACGKTLTAGNNLDVFITYFKLNGVIILNKKIDLGFSEEATSISSTSDHGLILSAVVHGSGSAPYDKIGIIKLDSNANLQWGKIFNYGTNADIPYTIKQVQDSNYMLCGYIENFPPFDADGSLIYLDKNGNIIWSNKYQVGNNWSMFKDFEADNFGITGLISTPDMKLCLARIDYSGNLIWNKSYYGAYQMVTINDQYTKLNRTSDGKLLLTGMQTLIKTDSTGNLLWSTSPMMYSCRTIESNNKDLTIIGNGPVIGVTHPITFNPHIGIVRADSVGNFILCNQIPNSVGILNDSIYPIGINYSVTTSGAITSISIIQDTSQIFVNTGCVNFYGSNETVNYSDSDSKFYPNPAGDFTSIKLNGIEKSEYESVKIFDAFGREMLINGKFSDDVLQLNLATIPSGIYFICLNRRKSPIKQKLLINH